MIHALVDYIVKDLVTMPDRVQVTERAEQGKRIIEITVAPEDLKLVIGKEGGVIKSIRGLVHVVSRDEETEVILHNNA